MMRFTLIKNKKAQALTEFAIMGSVVLMVLLYLAQQGLKYNFEQGLDMYAFRQALFLSKQGLDGGKRAVDLTVMRELPVPSLFSGLSRSKAMSSASVAANPFDLWTAEESTPGDIPTYQLVQMNEGMIQNDYFIKMPVTKVKVVERDGGSDEWSWATSSIKEFDSQVAGGNKTSDYQYTKRSAEDHNRTFSDKELESRDVAAMVVTMENDQKIRDDYIENDWENKIESVDVDAGTIPAPIKITLDETLVKKKQVSTRH